MTTPRTPKPAASLEELKEGGYDNQEIEMVIKNEVGEVTRIILF
jgi:hypothetical protein